MLILFFLLVLLTQTPIPNPLTVEPRPKKCRSGWPHPAELLGVSEKLIVDLLHVLALEGHVEGLAVLDDLWQPVEDDRQLLAELV